MKFFSTRKTDRITGGRAPQGARGLKFSLTLIKVGVDCVAPRKGRVG